MNIDPPHFQRCSWCSHYFDVSLATKIENKTCCPECAAELSSLISQFDESTGEANRASSSPNLDAGPTLNQNLRWIRCPVCNKFLHTKLFENQHIEGNITRQTSLKIHIKHTQEEQKQKIRIRQKQKNSTYNSYVSEKNEHQKLFNQDAQDANGCKYSDYKKFFMKAWYPESIDCSDLFWYHHALWA